MPDDTTPNPSPLEVFGVLYPDARRPGRLAVYTETLRCGKERSYWCHDLREADRLCEKYRKSRRVVFSPALHDPWQALAIAKRRRSWAVLGTIRGIAASVVALPALSAEIPYGRRRTRSGAGAPALPPDRRQALGLLAAVDQRPSIVISTRTASGGVIYAVWLLDRLWRFEVRDPPSAELAEARALLRRLRWAIARLAAERGWWLDISGDLAGTLPVPGSPTGAGARGQRANVEAFPLVPGDGRYRRRDFEYLPEAPAEDPQPWRTVLAPAAAGDPARRPYALGPIAAGCPWICHCRADRTTLPEVELKRAIRLLSRCRAPAADSADLIHQVCAGHPGYDRNDVDRKVAAALREAGDPITCPEIGEAPGVVDRFCAGCDHFGRIVSPVELDRGSSGAQDPPESEDAAAPVAAAPIAVAPIAVAPIAVAPIAAAPIAAAPIAVAPIAVAPAAAEVAPDPGCEASVAIERPTAGLAQDAPGEVRGFIQGLERAIAALGGEATARQIMHALATEPERFPELAAALERLARHRPPGDRSPAAALGVCLRKVKGRVSGDRALVVTRRARAGMVWAFQPPPAGGQTRTLGDPAESSNSLATDRGFAA